MPNVGEDIFVTCWRQLNSERTISADANRVIRITRAQVQDWLQWYGWQKDIAFKNEMLAHIIALDNVYIPWELKQIKQRNRKAAQKQKHEDKRNQRRANARKLR